MIEHYLGVDFLARRCYVVWMNKVGEIQDQRRLLNEEMPAYLDTVPPTLWLCLRPPAAGSTCRTSSATRSSK